MLLTGAGRHRIPGGGGSPVWTPAAVSPTVWYIGDDAGTVEGATVASWSDASGHSNTATAVTAPTMDVTTGLNLHRTVRFAAASNQYLTIPNVLNGVLTEGTVVFVAKAAADPAASVPTSSAPFKFGSATNPNSVCHYPYTDGTIYDDFGATARKTVGNPTPSLASWNIIRVRSKGGQWDYTVNGGVYSGGVGAALFSTNSNAVGFTSTPWLGRSGEASNLAYFNGNLAETFVAPAYLTDADAQKAEGYCAYKYGLQSVLDAAHPYKSTPP